LSCRSYNLWCFRRTH